MGRSKKRSRSKAKQGEPKETSLHPTKKERHSVGIENGKVSAIQSNRKLESQSRSEANHVSTGSASDCGTSANECREPVSTVCHQTLDEKEDRKPRQNERYIQPRIFVGEDAAQWSIVELQCDEELTVCGTAQLRVIHGAVTVLGHRIHASHRVYPLYSPNCYSLLTIRAISHTDKFDENSISINGTDLKKRIIEGARSWNEVNVSHSILEFQTLRSTACEFVTSLPIFSKIFKNMSESAHVSVTSELSVVQDDSVKKFRESDEFIHAKNEVVRAFQTKGNVSVAVCGGKNSGKSTFVRYLVNSLLNHTDGVAFLECDVGQTEFTPSCCVSLTLVTQPVLGPPFTHQTTPALCKFYGQLSPADDPAEYMSLVQQTFHYYEENHGNVPLVINTMGWNKGIGLTLLVDTIRTTRPQLVVQLNLPGHSRNLPTMQPELVAEMPGWLSEPMDEDDVPLSYQLIQLNSVVSTYYESRDRFTPGDYRNMALLAYFSQIDMKVKSSVCSLQAVRPYKIHWRDVAIHVCSTPVPYDQLMYALNCTVVALCKVDPAEMRQSEIDDYPRFFETLPDAECLGLGMVRGVDPVQKVLYILTPMSMDALAQVNTLLRGALNIPSQLVMNQKVERGELPYVGYTLDSIGANSIKPRRHLKRGYKNKSKAAG